MDVFKNQRRICALVVVCCIAIFELFAQEFEFVQKIPDSSFMLNDAVIFIDNETIAVFKGETLRFYSITTGKMIRSKEIDDVAEFYYGFSFGLVFFWREKKLLYLVAAIGEGGYLDITYADLNDIDKFERWSTEEKIEYPIIQYLSDLSGVDFPQQHPLYKVYSQDLEADYQFYTSEKKRNLCDDFRNLDWYYWYLINENYYLKWSMFNKDEFCSPDLVDRKTKKIIQINPPINVCLLGTKLNGGSFYVASLKIPSVEWLWNKKIIIMDATPMKEEIQRLKDYYVVADDYWENETKYLKYRESTWPCRLVIIDPESGESKDTKLQAFYLFSRYSFSVNEKGNMIVFAEKDPKTGIFKHWAVYRIVLNGVITESGVKLRSRSSTTGEIITHLSAGTKVKVIDRSDVEESINGLTSYWYKVRLTNGTEGWMFGAWLKIEN